MLSSLLSAIAAPPADAFAEAQRHLDSLTKPPGSLGRLEEIAARLAVLRDGTPCVERPVIFTFAADHGVVATAFARKVDVVRRALAVNAPDPGDGVDVLAGVGGFEIAGLVGVILVGAARRVPVVLDGFIAGAAALAAVTLAPDARHALFASHRSAEPGHAVILERLGLTPYLDLEMRLGEGTGAALFIHLARAAALIWSEMATFKSAGVSQSEGARR